MEDPAVDTGTPPPAEPTPPQIVDVPAATTGLVIASLQMLQKAMKEQDPAAVALYTEAVKAAAAVHTSISLRGALGHAIDLIELAKAEIELDKAGR